jgi:basic membrane lipoprotein Med (substrate-binding protein (PBP1-ABC) superfamily)
MHDSARQIVQREFPLLTTQNVSVAEQCQSAYETLAPVMHTVKPDLLFSTDPHLMMVALRLSLEFHNTLIMQASPPFSRMHVSTYYGKTCEAAFLSGVLCGALSVTGKIGFVPGVSVIGATCEDMQAFAQGARTVRPLVEVYAYPQVEPNSENRSHAVETLGKMGCDYLLLPILPFSPLETKFFTGVFARVVCLSPGGQRQVASLAWHWDVFYRDILTNQTNDYPMHLNMGLRTGLVQVHPFANALNEWALRLFEHFRTLLRMDGFQAVDENMSVEICDVQLKEEEKE